ncbi:MAG TPA: DUF4392 domain-containing protein [Bacillota bacterium]|nr:DUF4392 domain-containing protein [Bacillota bacterium]HPU95649.1 DUF4392 domain-containing protein [Bacillota bacterium]
MSVPGTARAELLSEIIGEGLDRLATIDLHGRGIVKPIYDAARERQGGKPLSYSFSKGLIDCAKEGSAAVLATGFMIRRAMQPETDGITGTAYLAYVLSEGLGLVPLVACEAAAAGAVSAAIEATGLRRADLKSLGRYATGTRKGLYAIIGFPAAPERGAKEEHERAAAELAEGAPCVFVTIERPGKNAKGVPHTTFGVSMGDISADIDDVMDRMEKSGIPTFAVGDMGNELGMGLVSDVVGEITPYGKKCRCGCGGGVAASRRARYTMMGAISDDACYAVGASLAEQIGRADLLPDADMIERTLEAAVCSGAVDGITAENGPSIDMIGWETHGYLIGLMREQVLAAHRHDDERPQFIDTLASVEAGIRETGR